MKPFGSNQLTAASLPPFTLSREICHDGRPAVMIFDPPPPLPRLDRFFRVSSLISLLLPRTPPECMLSVFLCHAFFSPFLQEEFLQNLKAASDSLQEALPKVLDFVLARPLTNL